MKNCTQHHSPYKTTSKALQVPVKAHLLLQVLHCRRIIYDYYIVSLAGKLAVNQNGILNRTL